MNRGRIIWEKRARLVFYVTRGKDDREPPIEQLLARARVTNVRTADGNVLGAWCGLDCEAQLDVLPYHFVLQIALGTSDYLAIAGDAARTHDFVTAFGATCIELATEVGFVRVNMSSAMTASELTAEILDQEYRVLAKLSESLLAERFSLVYFDEERARYLPATVTNAEQAVARGRLLFGETVRRLV